MSPGRSGTRWRTGSSRRAKRRCADNRGTCSLPSRRSTGCTCLSRRPSARSRRTRRSPRRQPATRRTATGASGWRIGRTRRRDRLRCAPRIRRPLAAQSALIGVAWRSTCPVLEYTAKSVLTICTNCVLPAAPFVSGGRQLQLDASAHGAPPGRQMPSKFAIGAESGPVPLFFWITGSLAFDEPDVATRCSLSRAFSVVTTGARTTGKSATVATPWNTPVPTVGPNVAFVAAAAAFALCALTALEPARAMPTACAPTCWSESVAARASVVMVSAARPNATIRLEALIFNGFPLLVEKGKRVFHVGRISTPIERSVST